ncbi:hypothetical protein NM208_g7434 [Fusarium decemcellulare]|uniref:Uncharacterized protein n=1 Tax=Fusarium decemcellulare TaxID=57161 RepID=A0ACC1S9D6_9HYPO|nr:hypothetical protein NM208_g7434 [Fusarium decemcellulare]
MGLELRSAWSTPRGWKLITLTLFVLTLLLVVPLYQLSDDSPGVYGHLTKYLKHEGVAYDVEEGLVANLNETETNQVIKEDGAIGAGEAQANGEDGKKAQNDDNKPADSDHPNLHTDPSEGVGGPLQDDGKSEGDDKPSTEANQDDSHEKAINDEAKAGGAGGSLQVEGDDKPQDETAEKKPPTFIDEHKDEHKDDQNKGDQHKTDEHKDEQSKDNQNNDQAASQTETKPHSNNGTASSSLEINLSVPTMLEIPTMEGACDGFPNTDGITLVMKTGATEAYTKLPAHLLTSLQCVPDFLLFSDLEQKIGKYHIYDVLDDVRDEVKKGRKEFDLYKAQVDCPIPQQYCTTEMKGGWDLDKYKFLHMIERAWALRPNKEWYVFAEADSYVFWDNLVWYLRNKVNGTETPYVGSVAMLKGTPFAHGGSGYVIHGETVKKMVQIPDLAHKYDLMATHECCGDYLMSLAVMETGKKVRQAHPMFNGEKPVTLPFGNNHWCEPLLTMHHMNPEEGPIQIKDIYQEFFGPNLKDREDEWDNFSDDVCYIGAEPEAQAKATDHQKSRQKKQDQKSAVEQRAHQSEQHCAKVCEADNLGITPEEYLGRANDEERNALIKERYEQRKDDKAFHESRRCFQWRYQKNVCCVARSFKNGKPRKEQKPEDKWTSGWFTRGINDWIAAKGECEPKWKMPS